MCSSESTNKLPLPFLTHLNTCQSCLQQSPDRSDKMKHGSSFTRIQLRVIFHLLVWSCFSSVCFSSDTLWQQSSSSLFPVFHFSSETAGTAVVSFLLVFTAPCWTLVKLYSATTAVTSFFYSILPTRNWNKLSKSKMHMFWEMSQKLPFFPKGLLNRFRFLYSYP